MDKMKEINNIGGIVDKVHESGRIIYGGNNLEKSHFIHCNES